MTKWMVKVLTPLLLLWGATGVALSEKISLYTDYASFRGERNLTLVEIYYSFPRQELSFTKGQEGYLAIIDISAEVTREGRSVWSRNWSFGTKVNAEFEEREPSTIFDFIRLWLIPGDYSYSLTLRDRGSGLEGSATKNLKVRAFPPGKLQMSDIEIAYSIQSGDSTSRFYKNGLEVIPYPRAAYGPNYPVLFFYTEAYNLGFPSQTDYELSYSIFDVQGKLVKKFPSRFHQKPGSSAVLTGGVNVISLRPGEYSLKLLLRDEATSDSAWVTKGFFLLPPPRPAEVFTEEIAQQRRNEISYLATSKELKTFDRLSLQGKREFLRQFWRSRDPDPTTPQNEFKNEYYRRWRYAVDHYSNFDRKDGWQSDMGRIYILYGPPDQIERNPFESGQRAWQKWTYYVKEGGFYFIFIDLEGVGHYTLVHSTAKGEKKDPNWQRYLNQ